MMVLLPEGRAVNNPDTIKMVKIMPSTLNGKNLFVVSIKMDDDSELMIQNCTSAEEAEELANHCTDLINGGKGGASAASKEEDSSDESSDWDSE